MIKIPSLNYEKIIKVLQKNGWVIVRQKGSHIRLQKHTATEIFKITVPAHKPVKRSTLSYYETSKNNFRRIFKEPLSFL